MTPTDPWLFLQTHTPARIAQGRSGHSLPTQALLNFQLAHARARDAVYSTLELPALLSQLRITGTEPIRLHSQATDRQVYLQRPDLGRLLDEASRLRLQIDVLEPPTLSIVVADGLSATAVNCHAGAIVSGLTDLASKLGWLLAPVCVVEQGRVAIADEIAYTLKAEMVIILIGERPGLTAPDSLGAYITYHPRPGLTDADRNCVSNIRSVNTLSDRLIKGREVYEPFIKKISYLLNTLKLQKLSGVLVKDIMPLVLNEPDV